MPGYGPGYTQQRKLSLGYSNYWFTVNDDTKIIKIKEKKDKRVEMELGVGKDSRCLHQKI